MWISGTTEEYYSKVKDLGISKNSMYTQFT